MAPIFTGGIVRAEARRKREIIRKAKLEKKKLKVWFSFWSNKKHLKRLIDERAFKVKNLFFNPQAPVAQKIADEVVFQRFQGERVEFF